MDARSLRTRNRLRAAVLELSTATPIVDLTASEICRTARVTRDTFYRHANGPVELLADALSAEIAEAMTELSTADSIGVGELALLDHVQRRTEVYRGAMHPVLAAPVRAGLEHAIRDGLLLWLELHPRIVPEALAGDATALRMAIAYATAGTVGAIEAWLDSGEEEPERAARIILAASPEWWLR
ncbi:hypothetical protein MUN77_02860 [Leucobacter allii]|uniref:TetR/AcrR family transcriptional regulator n=1 Tax=Leucobacter allii TaxID=2932247 RepID=UPI001FD153D9|nr:hypothetical protein [Leucobacter allii]UOR02289.1 hypothetical protein MUN77_02860 [Leucobacter allii]